MLESQIERSVCAYARKLGWLVYKFQSPSNRGVPDDIFLGFGICFFIEFKATGKTRRKLQVKIGNKIEATGFCVFEIDSIEDGKIIIDNMTPL